MTRKASPHLRLAPASEPASAPTRTVNCIDNPLAPEIFSTNCCGFSIGQGTATLTFESQRCNHFDPNCATNRVVVGRVVMPIQAAQALVIELNNALQRSGFSPSHAATHGMVAQ